MLDAPDAILLVIDDAGFACVRNGSPALLAARSQTAAEDLLWGAITSGARGRTVSYDFVTAENQWAIRVGLDAGLSIAPDGPTFVRGRVGPLAPYLPNGPTSERAERACAWPEMPGEGTVGRISFEALAPHARGVGGAPKPTSAARRHEIERSAIALARVYLRARRTTVVDSVCGEPQAHVCTNEPLTRFAVPMSKDARGSWIILDRTRGGRSDRPSVQAKPTCNPRRSQRSCGSAV